MLNLRRKLLVSVFTLMLAIVSVATTTYAWFTIANTATVDGITLNVEGGEGLTIRITKINGVETKDDLAEWKIHHEKIGVNALLTPLTFKNEALYALGSNEAAKVSEENSPYVEITFSIRSEKQTAIYFKDLQAMAVGEHTFNSPIPVGAAANITHGKGAPAVETPAADNNGNPYYAITNARLANALRFAFKEDLPTTGTYNIIDPVNYDYVMAKGANELHYGKWDGEATNYYEELTGEELVVPTEYSYYNGKTSGIKYLDQLPVINTLTEVVSTNTSPYYIGEITIILWLEGYDADCFNAIIDDKAEFTIVFETAETAKKPAVQE